LGSWAALPGSRPLRVSATQTGATMPSSPGMKQIRRQDCASKPRGCKLRLREWPSRRPRSSREFHNSNQAPAVCSTRAQNCAPPAREDIWLRSLSMKTVLRKRHPPTRRDERSSGARYRVAVGGFRSRTAVPAAWERSSERALGKSTGDREGRRSPTFILAGRTRLLGR
jgi:hypothetical protein